ncbi:MAG: 50S ribosomal protein L19, partial [Candidatus Subteraquimicrobiales bacterium]|nr:50S ribosomal protein L19 [Candidatus Subteraquimicrobiales bacterium]
KIQEGAKSRIQVFEGLVMKTQHGRGINGTFTVRRISLNVGVEKCFPLHLPSIVKIEKLKSARVRRAKLYYVRDLVGKRAQRLKKEKEDVKVWEDVVVTEGDNKSDQPSAVSGQQEETAEKDRENLEEPAEKSEPDKDQPKADEPGAHKK